MVDKTESAFACIVTINEIACSKNNSWEAKNAIQAQLFQRVKNNVRKDDGTHCPGSAQSPVTRIKLVFMVGADGAGGHTAEIQQQVIERAAGFEYGPIILLHDVPKHIQNKHIDEQVHPVRMDKPAADETVPLPLLTDNERVKNKTAAQFIILKTEYGKYYR